MPLKKIAVAALLFAVPLSAALADRAPNEQERPAIEEALKAAGFTTWDEIELDDGKWEVDDAVHSDGKKYDVELDPTSYAILKKELED